MAAILTNTRCIVRMARLNRRGLPASWKGMLKCPYSNAISLEWLTDRFSGCYIPSSNRRILRAGNNLRANTVDVVELYRFLCRSCHAISAIRQSDISFLFIYFSCLTSCLYESVYAYLHMPDSPNSLGLKYSNAGYSPLSSLSLCDQSTEV